MLAMVLYALCECTPRQAGFDPFIIPASEPCPSDNNRLFANRSLLGRGTIVLPVEEIGGDEDDEDADLVLKLIWPGRRKREVDVIRQLREAIPNMTQHLPNVMCSADMSAEEVRLPSHSLGIKVII